MSRPRTEKRAVRSEDPSLSPAANDLLTDELQTVVGRRQVDVPVDTPRRSDDEHANHGRVSASVFAARPLFIVMVCVALVVLAVVALSTGEYLVLVGVGAVLVACLVVVAAGALQLTTETEHMDPAVAARLEAEGVADPDRVFTDLLEDFTGAREARGVTEIAAGGHNEGREPTDGSEDARAAVRQRSTLTPSSGGSAPAGSGSAIAALPWWVTIGATTASVVGALVAGGPFWAAPAVVIPICVAWIVSQRWLKAEGEGGDATPHRRTDDDASAVRRITPAALGAATLAVILLLALGVVADLL